MRLAPVRLSAKIINIWHTHGVSGVWRRGLTRISMAASARRNRRAQMRAWQVLVGQTKSGPVFFPRHDKPLVSIVIPVFNNVALTARCLNAVLRELDSLACEIIVVDDGSTDETSAYLNSCSGIRVLRHTENRGFVESANAGATAARGRFIHFLNNDTIVTPRWLAPLLRTFDFQDCVGAVGSQLRAPDGTISEAGAVIWRDGSGSNYGRGRKASDPRVSFPRDVDYCSGASMMIRADVFRELGGFSTHYQPAYYEDADLCFRARAAGYRVVYQPDSVVMHFEGATCGTNPEFGVKRYQSINRTRFAERWKDELRSHYPPDEQLLERAARRVAGTRTVLVMDSFIPFDDRSAGARRLLSIMRLMREAGWHVMFLAHDAGEYPPYTSRARRYGIEVIAHRGDAAKAIRSLPVDISAAWISRPDVLKRYLAALRENTTASIIYDTVDLHYLRLQREEQITCHPTEWKAMRSIELDLARRVEHVVVASETERGLLSEAGIDASVVPIIEPTVETRVSYGARRDILFLGNYTHAPNADAALWLAREIMPFVWERMPNTRLVLAGADPTTAVERLADEHVTVTGFVPDIRQLFDNARVFAAPLRFGGGMKGKIVQSLAHGLPVVTTEIGAEGIGLIDGESAWIRNSAEGLAQALVDLYNDERAWKAMASCGLKVAEQYTPAAVRPLVETALRVALEHQPSKIGVDVRLTAHSA